jgi:hypothetical protein
LWSKPSSNIISTAFVINPHERLRDESKISYCHTSINKRTKLRGWPNSTPSHIAKAAGNETGAG